MQDQETLSTQIQDSDIVPINESKPKSKISPFLKPLKLLLLILTILTGSVFSFLFYSDLISTLRPSVDSNQPISPPVQDEYIPDEPYIEGDPTDETYDLVKLNSSSALCLDGSPGSYYISRTGDTQRILIFFEHGGWCGDRDFESTFNSCYQRSQSWHGTSKILQPTWRHQNNVFSKHPSNYFRNWKKIHLNYCDGAGHQGTRKLPVELGDKLIYFRGHNITTENLEDLEQKIGLFSKAKRVVVSGLSAGGLAVFTWTNYIKERVKNGKVYALADSGIFYDAENVQTKSHFYRESMINIMKLSNEEIDPPVPECIQDHPDSKVDCMLAQNLHKYIKIPLFTMQSQFDSWSVWNILGINCWDVGACNNVSDEYKQIISEYSSKVVEVLKEIGRKPGNAIFGLGCMLHGMLYYDSYINTNYTIPASSNMTFSKAIEQWFNNPTGNNFHMDWDQWPSNAGCSKS